MLITASTGQTAIATRSLPVNTDVIGTTVKTLVNAVIVMFHYNMTVIDLSRVFSEVCNGI